LSIIVIVIVIATGSVAKACSACRVTEEIPPRTGHSGNATHGKQRIFGSHGIFD